MKKTIKKVSLVLSMCTMLALACTACGNKSDDSSEDKQSYTITFMNGEDKLGTASVKDGETIAKDDYSSYEKVDDADFNGWYETPSFLESSLKDLSKATFTKDTTLYGCFKANNVKEDTRVWYIAGLSEKGILKICNWATKLEDDQKTQFQLTATGKNTNEFAITLDLFKGDQFQLISDWAWDNQKGYGCVTKCDDTQVENGGGLDGADAKSNVNVIMDGNYTITLTTDPDNADMDTFVITRNSDPLTQGVE